MTGRTDPFDLRTALDRITSELIGERIGEQIAAVQDLRAEFPHSIHLLAAAVPGRPETFRYTCFQYAFRLVTPPPAIVTIATFYPHVYPSREFVQYLIDHVLIERNADEAETDDIVVYSAGGIIQHAGIVDGDTVRSKWGTAHLWRHSLFEVPRKYGSEIRVFQPVVQAHSQLAILDYAKQQIGTEGFRTLFPI